MYFSTYGEDANERSVNFRLASDGFSDALMAIEEQCFIPDAYKTDSYYYCCSWNSVMRDKGHEDQTIPVPPK